MITNDEYIRLESLREAVKLVAARQQKAGGGIAATIVTARVFAEYIEGKLPDDAVAFGGIVSTI